MIGVDQLDVAEHVLPGPGDQHPAGVQVRVELGRGVLGELEQPAQLLPGTGVRLDADIECRREPRRGELCGGRREHRPPAVRVGERDGADGSPVGVVERYRRVVGLQARDYRCVGGQILDVEHQQVLGGGGRPRRPLDMCGELEVVIRTGQTQHDARIPGVAGEAVEHGQPEVGRVEADDLVQLVRGAGEADLRGG